MKFRVKQGVSTDQKISVDFYKGFNGKFEDGIDVNYDQDYKPLNLKYISGGVFVGDAKDHSNAKAFISEYDQNGKMIMAKDASLSYLFNPLQTNRKLFVVDQCYRPL